ncbi:shikimate dehydrogenase family protein [Leucobacter soli]|uniref:Shikimate dehydrogenase (NADP(+)) n=1 Tax=Leucobacter soli TaxID=2812850 RepID=A0A916JR60_9MICO|nr:shikimate dehydrogenase [Leucobacter soli]CAG7595776.1 Shikimate dehydrogenase (NADP(+)) [Leucobacter soli]
MTDVAVPGPARLAVLGSPIGHSRSPRLHLAAYGALGLPWEYEAVECAEDRLEGWLVERGEEWRGLSLTMPLKEEARRLAAVLDPVAEESGVVNTLLRVIGDRWAGFNTDVGGLAAAIGEADLDATSTIVLGSGATAVSAVLAVRRLGARHVEVVARNASAVSDLVVRFGETREPGSPEALHVSGTVLPHTEHLALPEARVDPRHGVPTLVVSALPGPVGREIRLPEALLRVPLFDVAYDPWPSPLAERWRAAGGVAHSGLGMLLHQALLQIRIFVGGDPDRPLDREAEVLAAMRAAVAA